MPLDDLVLALQRFVDRLVRRARRGRAPTPGRRRLLVVQIDGLARGLSLVSPRDRRSGIVVFNAPDEARLLEQLLAQGIAVSRRYTTGVGGKTPGVMQSSSAAPPAMVLPS